MLGVAISGAIVLGHAKDFPPSWRRDLKHLDPEGRHAYAQALRTVYIVLLGIGIAAALCEISIARPRRRDKRPSS